MPYAVHTRVYVRVGGSMLYQHEWVRACVVIFDNKLSIMVVYIYVCVCVCVCVCVVCLHVHFLASIR